MTKPADIDLDDFVAWLERQPKEGMYNFVMTDMCALGRYAKQCGNPDFAKAYRDHPCDPDEWGMPYRAYRSLLATQTFEVATKKFKAALELYR